MRAHTSWLSVQEKDLIVREAMELLERVGMRLTGPSLALETLARRGAQVDEGTAVVRLPARLVRDAVEACPREFVLAGSDPEYDVLLADDEPAHFCSSGCAAFVLDPDTGERRPSTLADLRAATALLDESPAVDVMWTTVTANDVPIEDRELVGYAAVLEESHKHVTFVDSPSKAEPLLRIAEIVSGDLEAFAARPRFSTLLTAASPLTVDGALLDFHATTAARGVPVEVFTVPMAGATAPVTVAGTITQAVAEFLGVATAMQALAPGARLVMGASGSVMDMRACNISYAAPEAGLMNAACIEVAHHLGVPSIVPGLTTDAKHAGVQAGYEKALKGLTAAAAHTDLMSGGVGMLDSVNTLFLPQIVIDTEIVGMIQRLLGDVEITREAMLLDMIERVGIGGNFLREKETTRRIRAGEHYRPIVSARESYDAWKADGRDELDLARERMAVMLAAHDGRRGPLSDDQRSRLASVCGTKAAAG
jgi:trimethylamine--corrinoid protein Co-methyltransferase